MSKIANSQSACAANNPHSQSEIRRHCRKSANAKYNPQTPGKNPHGFTRIRKPPARIRTALPKSAMFTKNPHGLAEIRKVWPKSAHDKG